MSSTSHFPDLQSFQQQSDDFISWLQGNPGVNVSPKIKLSDLRSSGAGRGVVARTNIAEGEALFSIPRTLVLAAQNSELKILLPDEVRNLGPWLSLVLVMLYEYLAGERSKWAPYFRILPTRFDTLMFWSPAELQELQASDVVGKIGKQDADKMMQESIAPIVKANPALFPPVNGLVSYEGEQAMAVLLELAHMMGSLIMAYAFDVVDAKDGEDEQEDGNGEEEYMTDDEEEDELPTSKGMVPLADLLNADSARNNARLYQEEEALVMYSIKPIQEGEEIFNDYGDIPRADLLRRYGYVTDNYAPFDVIELSLESICRAAGVDPSDAATQSRLQFLEDEIDDTYEITRPSTEDSLTDTLPADLIILLKAISLPGQEWEQSKKKLRKARLDIAQARILQKALQTKQAQYTTSLADDRNILESLPPPNAHEDTTSLRRRCMALQVRIGEKEILRDVLAMLDSPVGAEGSRKRTADDDGNSHDGSRLSKKTVRG